MSLPAKASSDANVIAFREMLPEQGFLRPGDAFEAIDDFLSGAARRAVSDYNRLEQSGTSCTVVRDGADFGKITVLFDGLSTRAENGFLTTFTITANGVTTNQKVNINKDDLFTSPEFREMSPDEALRSLNARLQELAQSEHLHDCY